MEEIRDAKGEEPVGQSIKGGHYRIRSNGAEKGGSRLTDAKATDMVITEKGVGGRARGGESGCGEGSLVVTGQI